MTPTADPTDKLEPDAAKRAFGEAVYPWTAWFDGSVWLLSRKKHFPHSKSFEVMYAQIRNAASRLGFRLTCRCHYDTEEIAVKAIQHDA